MAGGMTTRAQARKSTDDAVAPPKTSKPRPPSTKIRAKAPTAPKPTSIPHLPDEVWTSILRPVRQSKPVIGATSKRYEWKDLHQDGLAAMMRVSVVSVDSRRLGTAGGRREEGGRRDVCRRGGRSDEPLKRATVAGSGRV
jgi:hypothetical protein